MTATTITQIQASGASDQALSPDGTRLYVATSSGQILVYNTSTLALVATWTVGNDLGAISLSSDGVTLFATENTSALSYTTIYAINTITGASHAVSTRGSAFTDIQATSETTAVVTGGGFSQPQLVSSYSNTFTPISGAVYYSNSSFLNGSGTLTLLAESGISNGPLFIYNDVTNTVTASGDDYQTLPTPNVTGFNNGVEAISQKAGLVAQFIYYSSINLYDLNLKYLSTISIGGPIDALQFDVSGNLFYHEISTGNIVEINGATGVKTTVANTGATSVGGGHYTSSELLINANDTVFSLRNPQTGAVTLVTVAGTSVVIPDNVVGGSAIVNNYNVTIGASTSATVQGYGNIISLGSGDTLNVIGWLNTLSAVAGDVVNISGNGGDADTVNGSNVTVTLAANASANLYGNADTVTLGTGDSVGIYGANDAITAVAGDNVTLVHSGLDADNVYGSGVNLTLTDISAANIYGSNEKITLGNIDNIGVYGNNESITAGTSETVTLVNSVGDTITGSGMTLALAGVSSATLTGNTNTISFGNADALTLNGSHNTISVYYNDTLIDTGGSNNLSITGSGNTLTLKNDSVSGGGGANTYVFHAASGNNTIGNFVAGNTPSHDTLQFDSSIFADWAHLLGATTQQGSDLLIKLDATDSITLKNTTLASFVAADATFV